MSKTIDSRLHKIENVVIEWPWLQIYIYEEFSFEIWFLEKLQKERLSVLRRVNFELKR